MVNRISGRLGRQREAVAEGTAFQDKVKALLNFIDEQPDGVCGIKEANRASSKAAVSHVLKHQLVIKMSSGTGPAQIRRNLDVSARMLAAAYAAAS